MENVGYAALQIIPSMKGFESKLTSGTTGPFRSAGSTGGRLFGDSAGKSITSSVKAHAKTAALAGAAAFSAVGLAAFKLGKDSIAQARESQKVGAITTQVIKSTGGAARVTAAQVGDLSTALSNKAGIDDEVIQRGANMLLTFKGIQNQAGKNNKIFNQSVGVTTDLAAAMAGGKGGELDLKAASIQVGKALNDPVKGVTALQKVGVSFTNLQRAQIKALVEGGDANAAMATGLIQTSTEFTTLLKGQNGDLSKTVDILTHDLTPAQKKTYDMYAEGGHTLEAQKRILKELNSEFGGTAAAQATMGEKVKVAWGNVEEQLGTALLPLVDKAERAFLKKGVPAIEGWADSFQKKGVPAIKHFYREAKPVAEDVLPAVFDLLKAGKPVLRVTAGLVGNLAKAFTKVPHWAQVAIAGGLLAGKAGGFKLAGNLFGGKGLLGGVSKASPMPVFVVNEGFGGAGGGGIAAAGGGKLATAAKLGLGLGGLYLGGKAFKDSGIPQGITDKVFHTNNEDTFGKVLDGDQKAIQSVKAQMKAASDEWGTFSDNATFAFDMVDGAISKAMPLMKQYRHVLEGSPRDVRALAGISNYAQAIHQVNTLKAGIDALAGRGIDNGVPYLHGGVNFNGPIHVQADDPKKFVGEIQRRHRRRALGGVG